MVVAHHDDEVLFAGGLLTQYSPVAIVVVANPKDGRKDTLTREDSFARVCEDVGSAAVSLRCPNPGGGTKIKSLHGYLNKNRNLAMDIAASVSGVLFRFGAEVVITHAPNGDYGHIYHKLVSKVVLGVADSTEIQAIHFAEKNHNILVKYDKDAKKNLLDHYLPHWRPDDPGHGGRYSFAYKPEGYRWL